MKVEFILKKHQGGNMASYVLYCAVACCIIMQATSSPITDDISIIELKNGELVGNVEAGLLKRIKSKNANEYIATRRKRSPSDVIEGGVAPDEFDIGPEFSEEENVVIPSLVENDVLEGSSRPAAPAAPQFMLDLFERFEQDPSMQPTSNIIRSFSNLATKEERKGMQTSVAKCDKNEDICVRKHLLLFNVSSILSHEKVKMAELRLYKIVERDRRAYVGVDRKVEVVEITCDNSHKHTKTRKVCIPGVDEHREVVLDSKHIYGRDSGWETFNISKAVQRWIRTKSVHQLQINIETINNSDELTEIIDIDPNPSSVNEPLLIVFSDDSSRHHRQERKNEIAELINHQPTDILSRKKRDVSPEDDTKIRSKRHAADSGPCRVESMYVKFSDINYDSWIVNPTGYYANKCVGSCNAPFHGQNPTTHVVIQGLLNTLYPDLHHKPCCVPTKLDPISMLYRDQDNTLVYKYRYEGMKVSECGCR